MSLNKSNKQKINSVTGKPVDPMFDGHLEKPLSKMTPREKIHYIWLQMVFKYQIKDRKLVDKKPD